MKYFWDIDTIKSKIDQANNSDNKTQKDNAKMYGRMLADLSVPKKVRERKVSKDHFFGKLDIFDITYFDNSIFKLIVYMNSELNDIDCSFDLNYHEKKNGNVIVKMCKDFYKKNDKESLTYFKKIVSNEGRIYFNENALAPFMGRSYILSSSEYYILVNGRNYLEDALALIHETKHIEQTLKNYNQGITHYSELSSILYELYMIDYLRQTDDNKSNVALLQMQNLDKYIKKINTIAESIDLIKKLKEDKTFYENIYTNYDVYYEEPLYYNTFNILNTGISENEIGCIISFIVALDIYLKSNMNNINNVLSCYIFGIYKMKPSIIDNILEYLNSMYRPYLPNDDNVKKKKMQKLY